jgi:hypothetical protein
MKQKSSNKKTSQRNPQDVEQAPSAGSNGIAVAPPAYGIGSVDHGLTESQTSPGAVTQRQADVSITGGDVEARSENKTGLPDSLKAGIESLSGLALDDVRVHYNSSRPAGLQALAYAQGTEIHVAPGQEKHLPHEAWHVVQQAQGRVKPTMQMKAGVPVNDDVGLEVEADLMGQRAANETPDQQPLTTDSISNRRHTVNRADRRVHVKEIEEATQGVIPTRETHVAQRCQYGHPEHINNPICPWEPAWQPDYGHLANRDVFMLVARQLSGGDYLNVASLNKATRTATTTGPAGAPKYVGERAAHIARVQQAVQEGRKAGTRYQARKRRLGRQQREGLWTHQEVEDALKVLQSERKYTDGTNRPNW